jgi:hypothetical protein
MKKVIFALCIGLTIGLTSNALAATIGEKVEAIYTSFNFVLNGEKVESDSLPIVINGTSYLPVRSIANMLGYDVTYKADTKTIVFNDPELSFQTLEGDYSVTQTEEVTEYKGLRAIVVDGQTYFSLRDYSIKFAPISWGYDADTKTLFLARYEPSSSEVIEVFSEVNRDQENAFIAYKGESYLNISHYQEIE